MTPEAFEAQLRNLDQIATRVRVYSDRETWRFEFAGKPYFLHFYPQGSKLAASGAPREFAGLKTLQDFKIPAVRVAAMLSGYRFGNRKGNALIVHGVEPARRLSDFTPDARLHKRLVDQMIQILQQMSHHDVGHTQLRPSSFLVRNDELLMLDATDVHAAGLTTEHLLELAHRFTPLATRADRVRVWRAVMPDKPIPDDKKRLKRFARDLKHDFVEPLRIGDWTGRFKSRHDRALAFSHASRLTISADDWKREWPRLIERLRADQLDVLKRDASGEVLSSEIILQGVPIQAILKRPRNKFWYRHLLGAFRSSRARRLWEKARWLQARNIPVEYPLIVMQRRKIGYIVESIALFERVPGSTLDQADLNAMTEIERDDFFRACGRILRRIEDTGLTHTDAKSSNWIVFHNPSPLEEEGREGREGGSSEFPATSEHASHPSPNPSLKGRGEASSPPEGEGREGGSPESPATSEHASHPSPNPSLKGRGSEPVLIDAYGIRPLNVFLQLFGIRRLLRAMKDHPQYTPADSLHLCQGFAPRVTPEVES